MNRRTFLKAATGGLGSVYAGARGWTPDAPQPSGPDTVPDIVVVGAGAFGGWTALYLREMGVAVALIDQYGAGNSRSSSGGETRQIRAAYGDRDMTLAESSRHSTVGKCDRRSGEEHYSSRRASCH
jgi:FAD dependent oxidoreductase